MADVLRILGQVALQRGVLQDVYKTPVNTGTVVSSIVVCNRGENMAKVRVAIAAAGATNDPKQYLYYDTPVPGNTTLLVNGGFSMAQSDVMRAQADSDNVTVQAFGVEVKP